MHRARIVCVGTAALDTIALVERLPNEDERIEAMSVATFGGGNAATSAVTIARLGLPVEFSGIVGDDTAGDTVIAQLQSEGVGTNLIECRPGVRTAQSVILVAAHNASRAIMAQPAPAPESIPLGFAWVHLDKAGYLALPSKGVAEAKISLDDGNRIPSLRLELIDLYVPTAAVLKERFESTDPGHAALLAAKAGAGMVVATDGSNGSILVEDGRVHYAPAHPITPFSTLGAGDVFHGALLAAIVLGKSPIDALRFANITAALSCRALDGRSGIPTRDEVEDELSRLPHGPPTRKP